MLSKAGLPCAATVALWGCTIGLSFTAADPRLWACSLAAASVLSLALIYDLMVGRRIDLAYVAMAQALITRPDQPQPDHPGEVVPIGRGCSGRYRA